MNWELLQLLWSLLFVTSTSHYIHDANQEVLMIVANTSSFLFGMWAMGAA
jgi:hypothetical protein